jgi:hypothetical protein
MIKDPDASPKQAEDFIYNMTFHAEILPDHSLRISKVSHPSLDKCFPSNGPITIAHGEALAKWCASAGGSTATAGSDAAALKKELWEVTKSIHNGEKSQLAIHLLDNGLMNPDEKLDSLTANRLREIITKVKQA